MTTPAGQRWTRDKPTQEGWYWYRDSDVTCHSMVYVEEMLVLGSIRVAIYRSGDGMFISKMSGEFQGPLTPHEATA